ncbi:MAG: hypothetical protein PHU12_03380 [Candidatus Aenigmarchaeota archaeon]|nr:hypothetical protein [Candidatus Aenigmarchaeota archaeon]
MGVRIIRQRTERQVGPVTVIEKHKSQPTSDNYTFQIETALLRESYKYLLSMGRDESLLYIGGTINREENLITATDIFLPEMSRRETGRVTADRSSTHDIMTLLDEKNLALAVLAHVHPGIGRNSVYPSSLDIQTQRGYEACYKSIGVIFSRNNYFRFYSDRLKFNLKLVGSNIKKVDAEQPIYYFV